ncbi:MAG: chemotaxis protein CheW [Anaerolineales bacterium]
MTGNKIVMSNLSTINCWRTIGVWGHDGSRCAELEKYIHCRNCPIFSENGHSVLDILPPSDYLTQWRKEISKPKEKKKSSIKSVLVFRVGKEWFALQANILSEIADDRAIHRIPQNENSSIMGIVNVSGVIKVCYSLADMLGLSPGTQSVDMDRTCLRRLVIFKLDHKDYVFLADEVSGLCWYADSELQPIPSTLSEKTTSVLLGSLSQGKNKVAVFNIDSLQTMLERITL